MIWDSPLSTPNAICESSGLCVYQHYVRPWNLSSLLRYNHSDSHLLPVNSTSVGGNTKEAPTVGLTEFANIYLPNTLPNGRKCLLSHKWPLLSRAQHRTVLLVAHFSCCPFQSPVVFRRNGPVRLSNVSSTCEWFNERWKTSRKCLPSMSSRDYLLELV